MRSLKAEAIRRLLEESEPMKDDFLQDIKENKEDRIEKRLESQKGRNYMDDIMAAERQVDGVIDSQYTPEELEQMAEERLREERLKRRYGS